MGRAEEEVNAMKIVPIIACALLLGASSIATAAEPTRLTDQALDSVSAGALSGGIAFGFSTGTTSTGLSGGSFEQVGGRVLVTQQVINGVPSSTTQVNAISRFKAYGNGPGATSATAGGGVGLMIF